MAKPRRSRFAFAGCGCFGGQLRGKVAEDEYPVKLHIYDLSQGMARQLSTTVLGKPIDAIWHIGVVVHGKEYYFGGGIQQGRPGRTPYGTPVRVERFGVTHVAKEDFEGFLQEISPRYTPETYNLLSNNCNHFSNEVVKFLVGSTVPSYILDQPKEGNEESDWRADNADDSGARDNLGSRSWSTASTVCACSCSGGTYAAFHE